MTDELFRGQSAQIDTTLRRKESLQPDDIFKDQTSKLGQLPHKKVSREEVLEETREQVSYFTGIGNRLFVVSFAVLLVLTITAFGGIMFVQIENSIESGYEPFGECFRMSREGKNISTTETVNLLEDCIKRNQSLDDLPKASLFVWSLYVTVGYGHRFPHSFWGQFSTVFFAWLVIPIYMTLKMEFGEILTLCMFSLGRKVRKVIIRIGPECLTRKMMKEKYHPSDATLVVLLFLLLSTFVCLMATIVYLTTESEKRNFWVAFYLTLQTIFQVGLGDVTPEEEWATFVFFCPLVLVGDSLTSFLFFYVHGLYKLYLNKLAICLTGCHTKDDDDVPERQQLALAKSVADFVAVTNHIMPLRTTSADMLSHEVTLKTAKSKKKRKKSAFLENLKTSTPPHSGKEDNTQSGNTPVKKKKQANKSHKKSPPVDAASETSHRFKQHYRRGLDLEHQPMIELRRKTKNKEEQKPLVRTSIEETTEDEWRRDEEKARRKSGPLMTKTPRKTGPLTTRTPMMSERPTVEKKHDAHSKVAMRKEHAKKKSKKKMMEEEPKTAIGWSGVEDETTARSPEDEDF